MSILARASSTPPSRFFVSRGVSSARRPFVISTPGARHRHRRRPLLSTRATSASSSIPDADPDANPSADPDANPSADPSADAEDRLLLDNVCVVLCRPQGPQNVGGIARVLNNFGITDLRIVTPEPSALAPPHDALDADDRPVSPASTRALAPLADEARKFAVHADWLLRDAARCADAAEALSDVTFVAATTARPRENLPIVSARDAVATLRDAASLGKVAVVFGNEATGLTNDELALANLGVMIPTSGHAAPPGRAPKKGTKGRYTGGVGPTSLNLSHAVGVLAYELHQEMGGAAVAGFHSKRIDAAERTRLAEAISDARKSLDVLRPADDALPEDDRLLEEKEARAVANVLNAGPIASRDAAALFYLARRTAATAKLGAAERATLDAARKLYDEAAEGKGGGPPGRKQLANRIRDTCGLNLTVRELERVAKVVEGREEKTP